MIALMRAVFFLHLSFGAVSAQDEVLEIWQRERVRSAERSALHPLVDMQDYVHYAQLNNPDVEAALWRWR